MSSGCKIKGCDRPLNSKGFCKRHYVDFYRNRRDFEGNPINGFKPRPTAIQCRYPKCVTVKTKTNSLRRGLCNKHRKWAEKGYIDWDTCKFIDPNRIPKTSSRSATCKIDNCSGKHKGLGFCLKHYSSYRKTKTIDIEGNWIGKRKFYSPNDRCKVDKCYIGDGLVKGFCKTHYNRYLKGILTLEGYKKRDLKRVLKYPDGATCKAAGCKKTPRIKWFCECCWKKIQTGSLDASGKKTQKHLTVNKGKKCSDPSCKNEANAKGLCRLHYVRKQTGYVGPEGYKNVGKTCSMPNCSDQATCRSMCHRHYRQALRVEKGLPIRRIVNKNRLCRVDHCSNKANSKLLCTKHYLFHMENKEVLNNLEFRPHNTLKKCIAINPKFCLTVGCQKTPIEHNLCQAHLVYFRVYQPDVYKDLVTRLSPKKSKINFTVNLERNLNVPQLQLPI